MVITTANKNLELTAKWIDKLYEPIQSVQNNWGTYEMKLNKKYLNMIKLITCKAFTIRRNITGNKTKNRVAGPLAILNDYYGTVTTMQMMQHGD